MAVAKPSRGHGKAGLKANFIQGQRVTDEATVSIVDDVLSREINPDIVAKIIASGGQAKGFADRTFSSAAKFKWQGRKENRWTWICR